MSSDPDAGDLSLDLARQGEPEGAAFAFLTSTMIVAVLLSLDTAWGMRSPGLFLLALPITLLFVVVQAVIVGLPLYSLARRYDRVNGFTAAGAGFATGALLPTILYLPSPHAALMPILMFGGLGGLGGLVFWQTMVAQADSDSWAGRFLARPRLLVASAMALIAAALVAIPLLNPVGVSP